jgi:probable H4MPT-linked C1 transfer pathway protein
MERVLIGWDIGGVNTKASLVESGRPVGVRERPFELQRDPSALPEVLRELAAALGAPTDIGHAVTMTAELSQLFRTKREGVGFVLDAVSAAFPNATVRVFTVDGVFASPEDARARPLDVAAANWMATAMLVARHHPDALVIDTGTTTTDIIPIVGGRVAASGRTDLDRLATGELCYTGVVRTPVEAIVRDVAIRGRRASLSAEGFALAGDVHVWRGTLAAADYDAATPDTRPATGLFAGERLRRAVCADREMLSEDDVSALADEIADAQREQIARAIRRVLDVHRGLATAVVTGRGAFLAAAAAERSGLRVCHLSEELGVDGACSAPAVAVGILAEETTLSGPAASHVSRPPHALATPLADVVLKIGGGMLGTPGDLEAVCAWLERLTGRRALLVPGGGPFADAVREVDARQQLSPDAAHWMAIRAMDAFAEQVASRLTRGVVVETPDEIRAAIRQGRVPVLAPSRWLRANDPLPHTWAVTSDSIAAWVAGEVGAARLILVKPRAACGATLTDGFFERALSRQVSVTVITVDQLLGGGVQLDAELDLGTAGA